MISQITVRNIALIDELTVSFDEGFNVLTGETGAGKSILIDAVNLALGERADRDLIQTGKDFARVELMFYLPESIGTNELLDKYGIEPEQDGSLLLMRELTIQGKNICRINGRTVTLSMLREISSHLVDIHGQHQHQSLLNPEYHMTLLDRLGGPQLEESKNRLRETYIAWQEVRREINRIIGINKDGVRRRDILLYQINEILEAGLKPGEDESLKKEREILIHAEKIINVVSTGYQELYAGSSGNLSLCDRLARIISQFVSVRNMDESLDEICSQLENIQFSLEDVVLRLRSYKEDFEHDPYRLEELETRLELINNIKRKYGSTIDEVLQLLSELQDELDSLDNSQERLEMLQKQSKEYHKQLLQQCAEVSDLRHQCAAMLEKQLTEQLSDLNMSGTRFNVSFEHPDTGIDREEPHITENGYDTIEFLISANPGEPLKPLAKIISGGEMSRIMLAFKTILGDHDEIPTMIFDEIDVGISGRTAQSVAEKIGSISRSRQIICVTHLPQIASMADTHFLIEKKVSDGRTRTDITRLGTEERKKEIARMIGGASLTQLSLEHAGELIETASSLKSNN